MALKQAPRASLETLGFMGSKIYPLLFIYSHKGTTLYMVVFVDDAIVTSNNATAIDHIVNQLSKAFALHLTTSWVLKLFHRAQMSYFPKGGISWTFYNDLAIPSLSRSPRPWPHPLNFMWFTGLHFLILSNIDKLLVPSNTRLFLGSSQNVSIYACHDWEPLVRSYADSTHLCETIDHCMLIVKPRAPYCKHSLMLIGKILSRILSLLSQLSRTLLPIRSLVHEGLCDIFVF